MEDEESEEEEDEEGEMEECPSPDPISVFDNADVIPEDEDYDQVALLRQQVPPSSSPRGINDSLTVLQVKLQYSEAFMQHTQDMGHNVNLPAEQTAPGSTSKPPPPEGRTC